MQSNGMAFSPGFRMWKIKIFSNWSWNFISEVNIPKVYYPVFPSISSCSFSLFDRQCSIQIKLYLYNLLLLHEHVLWHHREPVLHHVFVLYCTRFSLLLSTYVITFSHDSLIKSSAGSKISNSLYNALHGGHIRSLFHTCWSLIFLIQY